MKIVIGILVVAVIALVVGFVPILEVQREDTEPLNYEAQSYVKKEDARALRSAILSSVAFSKDLNAISEALKLANSFPEYYPIGHVSVRNTDKIQGTFKVEIIFRSGDKEYREEFTLELKPGQAEEVEKSANIHYDKDKWTWEYEVTPDTKVVTYHEKVPIFEYLLSRF
jgi:hypothetical protein